MLEAAVMLSHSWVEDMDECHEALNSYCESADWKRVIHSLSVLSMCSSEQLEAVKDRCCFKCEKYHAIGTCDFLQRNRWYCVDCGLNVSLETAG